MLFPQALFTRWPCVLHHLERQAHSASSSRLQTSSRRRFRAPKTYISAPKPAKKAKTPKVINPKLSRRRSPPKPLPKPEITPEKKFRGISTFDVNKLTSSDWMDISGRTCAQPHLSHIFGKPGFGTKFRAIWFRGGQRFPPNTKGFFYFDRPNPLPHPAAGHLRFKVVPEANPRMFASGNDLVDPHTGVAWEKHLVHMKINHSDRHLYDAILEEGLIRADEDRRITEMLPTTYQTHPRGTRVQVLNSILDPFLVDFSRISFQLVVIDPDRIYEIKKAHRWANSASGPTPSPYSGIGLCSFALLDQRDSPMHIGIRLIKYVEPPNPEAEFKQTVGALVNKYSSATQRETPVLKSAKLLSEHSYGALLGSPLHHFHE